MLSGELKLDINDWWKLTSKFLISIRNIYIYIYKYIVYIYII